MSRMRGLFAVCWALIVTGAAFGGDPATEELKRLAGFWKPESVRFDDAELLPDAKAKGALTLVIKDAEYRMYYCKDAAKDEHYRLFTADMAIDPTTKSFELNVKDGHKKGERRHGIYEFDGTTLRVCYGPTDKPRPTTFAAPKGSGLFCEAWVKEKRSLAPLTPPAP